MGYQNGFIASIILKNKPLREFNYNGKRTVKVPFGSEYVIRLKNKSLDPALVTVSIDDTDILNGSELVLRSGETIDLERFVDESTTGKKFKFISLEEGASTGKIDDPYRKENGLIRINFYKADYQSPSLFLRNNSSLSSIFREHQYRPRPNIGPLYGTSAYAAPTPHGIYTNDTSSENVIACASCGVNSAENISLPPDKGATIEGSESNQSFNLVFNYVKTSLIPTTVDIYLVGSNYKEDIKDKKWGVYLGSNDKPVETFKSSKQALLFAANADFGKSSVTVKELT